MLRICGRRRGCGFDAGNISAGRERAGAGDVPAARDGNGLYRNQGDGSFEDVGTRSGTLWADGRVERRRGISITMGSNLYITNGMISGPRREDLNSFFWRQVVENSPGEYKA